MSTITDSPLRTVAVQDVAPVVRIRGLNKQYGDFTAVKSLDLDINRGEIIGLLGPNGAGKTTSIDMIVGLQEPSNGSVSVFGLDPAKDRAQFTRKVAVQTQEATLFASLTVAETLRLFASLHEHPLSVASVAAATGMDAQANVKMRKLSGGQARRLLLGVALIGDPELIVLDEPSAGLDPAARQQLWGVIRNLRERGTTVLLTTHHMDEATELCDRVAIMVDGSVMALDTPENLVLAQANNRKVSFTVSSETAFQALEELPLVTEIQARPSNGALRVTVSTSDSDAVIAFLGANTGFGARMITVDGGNLEDVFLQLAATSNYSTRTEKPSRQGRFGKRTR